MHYLISKNIFTLFRGGGQFAVSPFLNQTVEMPRPIEDPELAAAFEAYVGMGTIRSVRRLWKYWDQLVETGRPRPTYQALCNWANKYHWRERAVERDRKLSKKLAEKNDAMRLRTAEQILQLLYARIRTVFDEDGNIMLPIQNYQDLNDTIRLALQIIGAINQPQLRGRPPNQQTNIKIIKVIDGMSDQSQSQVVETEAQEVVDVDTDTGAEAESESEAKSESKAAPLEAQSDASPP